MKIKFILFMQILVFLFSISSLLTKVTANSLSANGIFSFKTIIPFFFAGILMLVYAYFWQIVLSKLQLSVAYLSKGTMLFWSMIWSAFLFKEKVSWTNIVAVILIFIGVYFINIDSAKNESSSEDIGVEPDDCSSKEGGVL